MLIIGCDYHPSFREIAWLDTETGEGDERSVLHRNGEAEMFYRGLRGQEVVRAGIEATGHIPLVRAVTGGAEVRGVGGTLAQIRARRVALDGLGIRQGKCSTQQHESSALLA